MKKKGQLDPYAYIPLNRAKLNKRWDWLGRARGGERGQTWA